ncbi:hypothetical protein [Streptomyces sp. NPDC088766]|uniref:hypothetical protein n=1 Tax=Streptomyces sp. NPDC088766 TaxID=3365893 RepID=UPI0038274BE4
MEGADQRFDVGGRPAARPLPYGLGDRVALVQQVALAHLRHVTGIDHTDGKNARTVLAGGHPPGRLESK